MTTFDPPAAHTPFEIQKYTCNYVVDIVELAKLELIGIQDIVDWIDVRRGWVGTRGTMTSTDDLLAKIVKENRPQGAEGGLKKRKWNVSH